jgi:hypothetical protein
MLIYNRLITDNILIYHQAQIDIQEEEIITL